MGLNEKQELRNIISEVEACFIVFYRATRSRNIILTLITDRTDTVKTVSTDCRKKWAARFLSMFPRAQMDLPLRLEVGVRGAR